MTGAVPPAETSPQAHASTRRRTTPRLPLPRAARAGTLATVVLGLVAVDRLALTPPSMPANQIDPGWQLALNHAALHALAFGREVVHNFGPLGFLHLPMFDPALYGWCVLFGCALALVVTADLRFLGNRAGLAPWVIAAWGVALVVAAAPDPDGRFYLLCLVAAFVALDADPPPPRWLLVANVVVLAAVALAKFSHGVTITLLVALMSLRHGLLPGVAFAVAATLFWLAAGQPLAAFPAFVRGSLEIAAGYSETVVEDGPLAEIVIYLVGAAGLAGLLVARAATSRPAWRWLTAGYVGLLLLVILRHAFTLHLYHALTATMGLMVASLVALGACWPGARRPLGVGLALVAAWAIGTTAASRFAHHYAPLLSPAGFVAQTVADLPRLAGAATGWAEETAAWAAARRRLANDHPLPVTATGTLDVLGWQTAIAMVHPATWQPKPVFQQYAAATATLAERNARYIATAGAETLLADVTTIGQRPPLLDTGPTFLEVLRHYDVAEAPGEFLVLRRRATPRAVSLTAERTVDVRLGERVEVPAGGAPVWVRFDVGTTAAGRLWSALLKRPKLLLDLELVDGRTRRFTVFPGMTRSGFLLSPLVLCANGLGAVMTNDARITSSYVVRALTLREATPAGTYAEPIAVTFATLDFAPGAPPATAATGTALPLGVVDGAIATRVARAGAGLVLDVTETGGHLVLPFVAPSRPDEMRWVDLDVELPHADELTVYVRRPREQFGPDRSVMFQLSPGRHRVRVPLPVSPLPVQLRVDPGSQPGHYRLHAARVGSAATDPPPPAWGPIRMRDIAGRGLGGSFLPFPPLWKGARAAGDTWAYEPVGDAAPDGVGETFPLDAARALAGATLRADGGALAVEVGDTGGGIVVGEVAPLEHAPRVLELVLHATTPTGMRLWWGRKDEPAWDPAHSVGVMVDTDATVVRVPIPGSRRPIIVRLDVDPGSANALRLRGARLLPATGH